jgi:hypothetical protein
MISRADAENLGWKLTRQSKDGVVQYFSMPDKSSGLTWFLVLLGHLDEVQIEYGAKQPFMVMDKYSGPMQDKAELENTMRELNITCNE